MRISLSKVLGACVFLLAVAAGAGVWWLLSPVAMPQGGVEVTIEPGTSPKEVAFAIARSGVAVNPYLLYGWFRLSGQSRLIRAGSYEWTAPSSPADMLEKLVRGDATSGSVTLVEGWNIRQMRQALRQADLERVELLGAALVVHDDGEGFAGLLVAAEVHAVNASAQ